MKTTENNHRFAGFSRLILVGLAPIVALAVTSNAMPQTLAPGDIVIATQIGPTANKDFGLVLVDPATGNRTVLSDNTTGSGPDFAIPEGVAIEPDGSLLVVDQNAGPGACIIRVDPATGNRTIMSGAAVGTGPGLSEPGEYGPFGIVEDAGTIYVAGTSARIMTIDPSTGDRTPLPISGAGQSLMIPVGVATTGSTLLVTDYNYLLYQVDLATGQWVHNTVTPVEYMTGVTVSRDGTVFVASRADSTAFGIPAVYSANLASGILTLVSGGSVGSGPTMGGLGPALLATEQNGTILLTEDTLNAVLSIDPTTGNRILLSDATHGTGPTITNPQGILVVPPVPEPSSIALLAIGVVGLAAMARCRRVTR